MKKIVIMIILVLISGNIWAQEHCRAYTNKGTQCQRKVVKAGYCNQHYTMRTGVVLPKTPKIELPEEWVGMSTDKRNPDLMVAWRDSVTNIIHLGYKH